MDISKPNYQVKSISADSYIEVIVGKNVVTVVNLAGNYRFSLKGISKGYFNGQVVHFYLGNNATRATVLHNANVSDGIGKFLCPGSTNLILDSPYSSFSAVWGGYDWRILSFSK